MKAANPRDPKISPRMGDVLIRGGMYRRTIVSVEMRVVGGEERIGDVYYLDHKGVRHGCWITTWKSWSRRAVIEKLAEGDETLTFTARFGGLPNQDHRNVFLKRLETLAEQFNVSLRLEGVAKAEPRQEAAEPTGAGTAPCPTCGRRYVCGPNNGHVCKPEDVEPHLARLHREDPDRHKDL